MGINDEFMSNFRKNPLDERKELEMQAKEHIIKAKAMRDILLNDTEQSYAVTISVGSLINMPIVCNHKLSEFFENEIQECEKSLRGEQNLFD